MSENSPGLLKLLHKIIIWLVHESCILTPLLFKNYSESISSEALDGRSKGVIYNDEVINNFRYANETVFLVTSYEHLYELLNQVVIMNKDK